MFLAFFVAFLVQTNGVKIAYDQPADFAAIADEGGSFLLVEVDEGGVVTGWVTATPTTPNPYPFWREPSPVDGLCQVVVRTIGTVRIIGCHTGRVVCDYCTLIGDPLPAGATRYRCQCD